MALETPSLLEAAPQVFILLNQVKRRKGEPEIRQERREKEENPGDGALVGERL